MKPTLPISFNPNPRHNLRAAIALWQGNLIDLETVARDAREVLARAREDFRAAVGERDRAAAHLATLRTWHAEVEPLADRFGPELAAAHAAMLIGAAR